MSHMLYVPLLITVDGVGLQTTRKRDRNRDAARKSRMKHTERANTLHEEFQSLEKSNSALQKEIAGLKREVETYEKMLKDHQPNCVLKLSTSKCSSFTRDTASLSVSGFGPQLHHLKEGALLSPSPTDTQALHASSPEISPATPNPLKLHTAHSVFRDESLFSTQFRPGLDDLPPAFSQWNDACLCEDNSSTRLEFQDPAQAALFCPTNHTSQNTNTQTQPSSCTPLLFSSPAPPLSFSQTLTSDSTPSALFQWSSQDTDSTGAFSLEPLNVDDLSDWILDLMDRD